MIYLCRHGQTEWNRERRLQGQTEADLTPLGRLQAAAMADLLLDLTAREPSADWR
ncbi:MAG: phosphoglycerate kinase, partial [Caulobacter sp. 39-67-4]